MNSTYVITGFHSVTSHLRHSPSLIKVVYILEGHTNKRIKSLRERALLVGCPTHFISIERLNGFAPKGNHQGIVALVKKCNSGLNIDEILKRAMEPAFLLLLDGITDPHNLGACIRTANAAGVHAVLGPRDRAVGLNTTARQVSCGASEKTPYLMVNNIVRMIRYLKDRGIWVVGADSEAKKSLYKMDGCRALALVMGSEGYGLRRLTRETCDQLVHIPTFGSIKTLNVSVASAICLYETVRQRQE